MADIRLRRSSIVVSRATFVLVLGCSGAFGAGNETPMASVGVQQDERRADVPAATPNGANTSPPQRAGTKEAVQLPEIVVTGSRLPSSEAQTAQDVRIYNRERIEISGQTTLADFLATLPEVSLSSPENTTGRARPDERDDYRSRRCSEFSWPPLAPRACSSEP